MALAATTAAPDADPRGGHRASENAARGWGEETDRGLQGRRSRPQPGACPHPRPCRSSSANPAPHRTNESLLERQRIRPITADQALEGPSGTCAPLWRLRSLLLAASQSYRFRWPTP